MHPITNIALTAARKASKIVLRAIENLGSSHRNIKERADFATEIASDAYREAIAEVQISYPEHRIWEENATYAHNEYIWYINAIDGMINYVHGLPHFAIALAVQHNQRIKHAIVYDPIRQEIFSSSRGEGAYLNNRRMRVSSCRDLEMAVLGISSLESLQSSLGEQILISGSHVLDLAYVAAGRIDGFYGNKLNIFELAAGTLLVKEAGGLVTDFSGEENYFVTGNVVASNPKFLKKMIGVL